MDSMSRSEDAGLAKDIDNLAGDISGYEDVRGKLGEVIERLVGKVNDNQHAATEHLKYRRTDSTQA